ncbi:MAG TPA: glycosyltransferase family 39 protein [Myxococcales bacterium]|jgi:4-amino-4-deoxy-L-arabinose transferase-like glycosyltransferase|nr:glycosyltransferase family 39 protein [Myxococcales bacterium]
MARAPRLDTESPRPEPIPTGRAEWGDTLPAAVPQTPWLRWLVPLSGEQRCVIALCAFALFLFVPWLGATGFWDPWEPHYGEVAREMIARGDYVHPWWESAYFFSKPALDLWLMAAGMLATNTNGPNRWVGVYSEWGVRLPYAAITAMGAILFFVAASRLISRRAALLGTVATLTAPLFVMLARQAVPDPIFVGLLSAAMACLMLAMFSDERRGGWVVAFYCFVGLATLSKGLLGFALPGAVTLVYCLVTGEWYRLRRLRLLTGTVIVLAIAAPWYFTMFGFLGKDDEGKSFFERFIVHDHFKRLVTGVYTTTPGGTFAYFIEQLGFDCFPWVFAFPGMLGTVLSRRTLRPQTTRDRALFFLLLWVLIGFAVFAFSATKFHHYAFPVMPPLLLLCAVWLERVLDEGVRAHAGEMLTGALLYALVAHDLAMTPKHVTDMFVFNYDRPYPEREVDPRRFFTALFSAAAAVAVSPWFFDRVTQGWRILKALPSKAGRASIRATWRSRMDGAPMTTEESLQDRSILLGTLVTLSIVLAIFLGWFHWRALSPHWTQRDLFWEYYHESSPEEPIGAYLMNWRGETFYSKNRVRQLKDNQKLSQFMAGPGDRKWLLVEQGRLSALRQALGPSVRLRVIESRNNKFALTVAERRDEPRAPEQNAGPQPQPPSSTRFGAPP